MIPITKIQKCSIHDGPGIRTTIFMKGCPLRCKWCHNPETQLLQKQIFYTPKKCLGCEKCLKVCKYGAHIFNEYHCHIFDSVKCNGCLKCTQLCPTQALESTSLDMSVDKIMDVVMKDYAFYSDAGGITLSGGEPMLHADECVELLSQSKKYGISTAIETSGYFNESYIEQIACVTDLFLWDFKDGNSDRHKDNTGVSNEKILNNLFMLDKLDTHIQLRCIMIKGVNMDDENLYAIADTYSKLKHCIGVELLPYHPYGGTKNEQLGYGDNGKKDWVPSKDDLLSTKKALQSFNPTLTFYN